MRRYLEDKTLVIGPSWVGDMIMAQVLFMAIKKQHPQTRIEVLAPQWSRPLTDRMPEVSMSIDMPFKHGELKLIDRYRLAKKLKSHHYQRSYVCPNSFKSALIPFWAQIPKRIGWRGEWRYGLLNDLRVLDKKQYPLMVERYEALGYESKATLHGFRPKLQVQAHQVESTLKAYQLTTDKPVLVLCPGAEFGPSKRWPESYYAEVAKHYLAQQWQVWILGSQKDNESAEKIQALAKGCAVFTGQTSLAQAIDLMSLANKVLTNDSGLMHIAAALDRPLVAVFGSTSPQFTPPLNLHAKVIQENVPCSPCFKRTCPLAHHQCMTQLSVPKVIHALEQLAVI